MTRGVCVNCGATVEQEDTGIWIDPDRQDSDNEGAYCHDGERHEVAADRAVPHCPNGHGPMVSREPGTPEQAWCGEWWDCAPGSAGSTCTSSYLVPSAELRRERAKSTQLALGYFA